MKRLIFCSRVYSYIYVSGWKLRFYVDQNVSQDLVRRLKTESSDVLIVDEYLQGIPGAYWRFIVADDPTVDRSRHQHMHKYHFTRLACPNFLQNQY